MYTFETFMWRCVKKLAPTKFILGHFGVLVRAHGSKHHDKAMCGAAMLGGAMSTVSITLSCTLGKLIVLSVFGFSGFHCVIWFVCFLVLIYSRNFFSKHPTTSWLQSFGLGSSFIPIGVESSIFGFCKVSLKYLVSSSAPLCLWVVIENIQPLVGLRAYRL